MEGRFSFRCIGMLLVIVLTITTTISPKVSQTQAKIDSLDWQTVIPDLSTRIWRSTGPEKNPILYVTTDQDFRRSSDNGNTWDILYPRPPIAQTSGISGMTFDPATTITPTLFVARNPSTGPAEIQRSTDDGLTWNTVFTTTASALQDLTASRAGNGELDVFAVGGAHVWRSEDGGTNWTPAETGLPTGSDLYRVVASPTYAVDDTLYLAAYGALFRSKNSGDSWERLQIPWLNTPRHVVFSPYYDADGTLWISYFWIEGHGEYPPNGIARSRDYGITWKMVNQGLPVNYLDGWIMGVGISPNYMADTTLYAVERIVDETWQVYRSQNGGDTWGHLGAAPLVYPTGLLFAGPEWLFLSSQSGLFRLHIPLVYWYYLPKIIGLGENNSP